MLETSDFFDLLQSQGFSFFTGVPDSLLKEFCSCISDRCSVDKHVITANEGGAVALAAGYHLATGRAGVVYMQNSGTGNAVNPLLSLADPEVYALPMMLIIGWRGEPGVKDEPQHIKQGKVQEPLLHALGYPYKILSSDSTEAADQVAELTRIMHAQSTPVLLLVRKETFSPYSDTSVVKTPKREMTREKALEIIIQRVDPDDRIVSTTGKASREIFEIREKRKEGHGKDFLTVGSMGHAGMIALGLARYQEALPPRRVVLIDGDGAALMHLGSMAIIGDQAPENFFHIILNNGSHDSVGGQPTIGDSVPFASLARKMGYKDAVKVHSKKELESALNRFLGIPGPLLIDVQVEKGARSDLGRPTTTPVENKHALMKELAGEQRIINAYGSIIELPNIIQDLGVKKILLFHGSSSYASSGVKAVLSTLASDIAVTAITDLPENPRVEKVYQLLDSYHTLKPDLLLAVGGGSVIDTAKAVLAASGGSPEDELLSNQFKPPSKRPRLMVVPTTAGSGSEATHFAVLYKGEKKYSLAQNSLLPDIAILDPRTTFSCPPRITLASGMDAICQAIESHWNRNANKTSRSYSLRALTHLLPSILTASEKLDDPVARDNMLLGAHFAGKAINLTKTTAGHALSYNLTSKFQIPHGLAVMLVMEQLLPLMVDTYAWHAEPLDGIISQSGLGSNLKEGFLSLCREVKKRIPLALEVADINGVVKQLSQTINLERLANHPVQLEAKDIVKIYTAIFSYYEAP